MLCEARTEVQCDLELFSTYHWAVNIAMSGPGSLFGGREEVMILLTSGNRGLLELQVGQRVRVVGRLRPGDLRVAMIDNVSSLSVIS